LIDLGSKGWIVLMIIITIIREWGLKKEKMKSWLNHVVLRTGTRVARS